MHLGTDLKEIDKISRASFNKSVFSHNTSRSRVSMKKRSSFQ